jgi:hypothetical protein
MAGRATTKGSTSKTTVINETLECSCCGKELTLRNFYKSYSILNKAKETMHICKNCIWKLFNEFLEESDDVQVTTYRICRLLDVPYFDTPFNSALAESKSNGLEAFKKYMKNINSLGQYSSYTFENGDSIDKREVEKKELIEIEEGLTDRDKQNEKDVLNMLGYDPFETESKKDRKYLFNRLVDMLDDSVLEDNLLLMSIIEIVKGFNQVDKINEMISGLTSDLTKLSTNNGGIKSLIDTKKNLMSTILKIAEDNGISTKFNTTKSKGAGTLAGIMKRLQDIGLDEAKVNLYDILTSQSMRQIADTSHQSIMSQLQLNESDYTDMIAQQKDIIYNIDKELIDVKEELRKTKIYLKSQGLNLEEINNVVEIDFEEDNSFGLNNTQLLDSK